jgi:hypothetical protein
MCCCDKPTINGQPVYKWQPNDLPSIYPVNPPELSEDDRLVYDEPGRCGKLDSHSHHFRVVMDIGLHLLVRHGGGDERLKLSDGLNDILKTLDTNSRYWLLQGIYHAYSAGKLEAKEQTTKRWQQAAVDKRIKTRKQRNSNYVKVWIEQA